MPPGYRLTAFDAIDSTNDEGLRRLRAGAGHGEAVWAATQSAGRGRRGRHWHSASGNLHLSLIALLPPTANIGQIAFVAALAAGAAIIEVAPKAADLRYKWPNDILIDGCKVAGILIETDMAPAESGGGGARHAVVGFGVNLVDAPNGPAYPATSLAALGGPGAGAIAPAELAGSVCRCFDGWYRRWVSEGFAPLRAAWIERAAGIGGVIEARLADRTLCGVFHGIDRDGALVLDEEGGERRIVPAADVYFPHPPGA